MNNTKSEPGNNPAAIEWHHVISKKTRQCPKCHGTGVICTNRVMKGGRVVHAMQPCTCKNGRTQID